MRFFRPVIASRCSPDNEDDGYGHYEEWEKEGESQRRKLKGYKENARANE